MNKLSLFFLCLLTALTVKAQESQKKESKDPNPVLEALSLAGQLASYGEKNKDPHSLVTAVRLLLKNSKTGSQSFLEKEKEDKATDKGQASSKKTLTQFDPRQLLASAKKMANNDQQMLATIQTLEKQIPAKKTLKRGALGGAVYTTRRVSAYGSYWFNVTFRGGRRAEIRIVGDGDTDLDFYVYDTNGNLIGKDDDYSDRASFYWTPRYTNTYRFKVKNRGNVYNRFVIMTN